MRYDHFLPFLRPPGSKLPPPRRSPAYAFLKARLPRSFFSESRPRRLGLFRKCLRTLGGGWLASPIRRIVQSLCFAVFLWLFFYVCWPYHAVPDFTWSGWIPDEVDVATGRVVLSNDVVPRDEFEIGRRYYIEDPSEGGAGVVSETPFKVVNLLDGAVELEPVDSLPPVRLEELSFSFGPWTLSERRPNAWPDHYARNLEGKETLPADSFLALDPLVSISTALAARSWIWSLTAAGILLLICLAIPRGFCGYLCPLGTLIDLFDGAIGKRWTRWRLKQDNGWWVHLKYYLLAAVLLGSVFGVLLSGFFAAIPVLTRGLLFAAGPLQLGWTRGWHQVPPMNAGQIFSIAMFLGVLGLGFLRPRFWCKYVCPSGAVFSVFNLFRINERKVEDSCIHCDKCVQVCPFDAIKPDFTTRGADCTFCQTCGGACPTGAIKFVERGNRFALKLADDPRTHETRIGRRGFLSGILGLSGGLLGAAGVSVWARSQFQTNTLPPPVRPPGSVPEKAFLEQCIRCGECFQACPNNVLQPLSLGHGFAALWTPAVRADWAGCEPSCNACGQVCPTGAIRDLPMEEKKRTRMGLAEVNRRTCLPWTDEEPCQLCVDECNAAGYQAIDFERVHRSRDAQGNPLPGSGLLAPRVNADRCVGCGLCQTRCFSVFVKDQNRLSESAIVIAAGKDKEDRLPNGSRLESLPVSEDTVGPRSAPHENSKYLPEFLNE